MSLKPSSELAVIQKLTYLLISAIATTFILIYTKDYLIPFIVALLVWFMIHEIREYLQWIPLVRNKFPGWLQSAIAFLFITTAMVAMGNLIYFNIRILSKSISVYEGNFDAAMQQVNNIIGYDVASKLSLFTANFDFASLLTSMINPTTTLFSNLFIICIYVVFILVEESIFPLKVASFYSNVQQRNRIHSLSKKMARSLGRYLTIKTVVSLITGVLSYFTLFLLDINAPLFWAFLIFVLNYIPSIGSLIATFFPAVFAIFQFGELAPFVYIMLSVGIIQVIVGNVIEPKLMGNSLNMSSLVVILSLTIWGAIWGVMGMILSVPITAMIILVSEEIPSLKFIAIALSQNGEIES